MIEAHLYLVSCLIMQKKFNKSMLKIRIADDKYKVDSFLFFHSDHLNKVQLPVLC